MSIYAWAVNFFKQIWNWVIGQSSSAESDNYPTMNDIQSALIFFYSVINTFNLMADYDAQLKSNIGLLPDSIKTLKAFAEITESNIFRRLAACQILMKWHHQQLIVSEEKLILHGAHAGPRQTKQDTIHLEIKQHSIEARSYRQHVEAALNQVSASWQDTLAILKQAASRNDEILVNLMKAADQTQLASLQWICACLLNKRHAFPTLAAYYYIKAAHNKKWDNFDNTRHYACLAATSLAYFYQEGHLFPPSEVYASHYYFHAAYLDTNSGQSFLASASSNKRDAIYYLQAALVCLSAASAVKTEDNYERLKQAQFYLDLTEHNCIKPGIHHEAYITALRNKVYLKLAKGYQELGLKNTGEKASELFQQAVSYYIKISEHAPFYVAAFYEAAHLCIYFLGEKDRAFSILPMPPLTDPSHFKIMTDHRRPDFPSYVESWCTAWKNAAKNEDAALLLPQPLSHLLIKHSYKEFFMRRSHLPYIPHRATLEEESTLLHQHQEESEFSKRLRDWVLKAKEHYGSYANPQDLFTPTVQANTLTFIQQRQRDIALLEWRISHPEARTIEIESIEGNKAISVFNDRPLYDMARNICRLEQDNFPIWRYLTRDNVFITELHQLLDEVDDATLFANFPERPLIALLERNLYLTEQRVAAKESEVKNLEERTGVQQLTTQVQNLTAQIADLKTSNETLLRKNEELLERNDVLNKRYEELIKRNEILNTKNDELLKRNDVLNTEIERLTARFDKLMNCNESLKAQNVNFRHIFSQPRHSHFFFSSSSNNNATLAELEDEFKQFMCPITHEIMKDPVIAIDGFTYERETITNWFTKNNTSPCTGETLTDLSLRPNNAIKEQIKNYLEIKASHDVTIMQATS